MYSLCCLFDEKELFTFEPFYARSVACYHSCDETWSSDSGARRSALSLKTRS